MEEFIIVYTTAGSKQEADDLAIGLVENQHAFCVTTVPSVKSTYYWEGMIKEEEEHLLIIKTRKSRFEVIEQWITKNHSYNVPEIIAVPISEGSKPYLSGMSDWIMT